MKSIIIMITCNYLSLIVVPKDVLKNVVYKYYLAKWICLTLCPTITTVCYLLIR